MTYSAYDDFAEMYNRYWGKNFTHQILPIIEQQILAHIPAQAAILDVCCGTGNLAAILIERGYQVTGIDGSEDQLQFARKNAPHAEFIHADARAFHLPKQFHAVVSCYDSLNHVMTLAELTHVFQNVYAALMNNGWFMFDLNMEQAFETSWRGMFNIVQPDHVVAVTSSYRAAEKRGIFESTLFLLKDTGWQRKDIYLEEACYSQSEIVAALQQAGFQNIQTLDATTDLNLSHHLGRMFFVGQKV